MERLVRSFIPVNSFTKEREERVEVPIPEVGLRWGKPADLQWEDTSGEDDAGGMVTVTHQHKQRYLIGTEIHREFETVQITTSQDQIFETESIKSVTFFCGRREEKVWEAVPDKPNTEEEVKVITDTHVRFSFPPNVTIVGKGARGDTPDTPTPNSEDLEADLDKRYGS